ncbi:MAG: hypothetical protein KBD23_00295 [Gammaproteobacteria bacterium]|nr:hypothetical protein [Gammaproteobacteria bacterium]MBP9728570.1 hypothetical protein [Gammaproteobacteria bacterium]
MEEQAQKEDSGLIASNQKINVEDVARLSTYPILSSSHFLQVHAVLDKFFELWPNRRSGALPSIGIASFLVAIPSLIITRDFLKNPKKEVSNSIIERAFLASMDGVGFILPFLMGDLIKGYCSEKSDPTDCKVSDADFFTKFLPAPVILSVLYIIWNTISPAQKYMWLSESKIKKLLVVGLDSASNMLLYSQIIQRAMLTIHPKPGPVLYEGVSILASLIVLVGESFQHRHRQKVDAVMRYSMLASLMFYMDSLLKEEFDQQSYSWSPILKSLSLPILFLTGVMLSVYYGRQYLKERGEAIIFTPKSRFSSPIQQQICAALQDSQQQDAIIKAILDDPKARERMIAKINPSNPRPANDLLASSTSDTIPRKISDITNQRDRAMLAVILNELGFQVTEEDDDDELETVLDPSEHAGRSASLSVVSESRLEGENKPLIFSKELDSYQSTADVLNHAANDEAGPSARSLSPYRSMP